MEKQNITLAGKKGAGASPQGAIERKEELDSWVIFAQGVGAYHTCQVLTVIRSFV